MSGEGAAMPRRRGLLNLSNRAGLALGVALLIAGAWVLWDTYERRGQRRPFPLRFIPGG